MAKTYITINTKIIQAKKLIEFLETLPYVSILNDPNEETQRAIDKARKRKTKKVDSLDEFFSELEQ